MRGETALLVSFVGCRLAIFRSNFSSLHSRDLHVFVCVQPMLIVENETVSSNFRTLVCLNLSGATYSTRESTFKD